jgi:hypothetical protein
MSSVAVPSKAGSHADLEVALEVADIRRLLPHDLWAPVVLEAAALASAVVSVAASTEDAADSEEEASKIAEAMAEVVVEESATKEAVASEAPTDTARHQTPQLGRAALVLAVEVATAAEVDMEALDHRIATVVVGMTRAVAVAHMMIDPADIAAALVVTETVMPRLEASVAATWSR